MARLIQTVLLAGLVALGSAWPAAAAQDPPPGQQGIRQPGQRGRGQGIPAAGPGVPLQQMQTMFDAYALVQAKKVLQLTDEQYQRFFARMNQLQDLRRRHAQQRIRLLNELRRMWRPQQADEAKLIQQIEVLDNLDEKFEISIRAAKQAIDEVLTVRQRAGFRFFEEDMDRQKLEFMTRSRQGR